MRNLVLIAGRPSHPPGQHEFRAGTRLLQDRLAGVPDLSVEAYAGGWVSDHDLIERADAVVIFSDGGRGHPLLEGDRLGEVGSLVGRSGGVGLMHYATELPVDAGAIEADAWVGGHYEDGFSCNPIWTARFDHFPDHPITRGVEPFETTDEWYINIRFAEFSTAQESSRNETRFWPILVATPSDEVRAGPYVWPHGPYAHVVAAAGQTEVVMWAVERPDGGRGFGLTGGHFHENWGNPQFRKVVLNALVWVTGVDVPSSGIPSDLEDDDLRRDLDDKATS
jgi:trehalose utilization protein